MEEKKQLESENAELEAAAAAAIVEKADKSLQWSMKSLSTKFEDKAIQCSISPEPKVLSDNVKSDDDRTKVSGSIEIEGMDGVSVE